MTLQTGIARDRRLHCWLVKLNARLRRLHHLYSINDSKYLYSLSISNVQGLHPRQAWILFLYLRKILFFRKQKPLRIDPFDVPFDIRVFFSRQQRLLLAEINHVINSSQSQLLLSRKGPQFPPTAYLRRYTESRSEMFKSSL